jgi:hypothetical protein
MPSYGGDPIREETPLHGENRAFFRASLGVLSPLVLAALCSPASPAQGAAAQRTVLAELFGSPACAECPETRDELRALDLAPEEFLWLEYHTESALSSADSRDRHEYYGAPLPPAIFLDGKPSSGDLSAAIEEKLAAGAPILVVADYLFDSDPWIGNVDVAVADGEIIEHPEECSVRFVIFEERVSCCGSEEIEWPFVVRAVLPPRPLTVNTPGPTQTIAYAIPTNPQWNVDFLRALAFVQRESDGSILNAVLGEDAGSLNPIPEEDLLGARLDLAQSFPNPTRSRAEIVFQVTREGWVSLFLFDIRGEVVRVLNDGVRSSGRHSVVWDGTDGFGRALPSGVYAYELQTSEGRRARKLTLLR